MSTKELKLYNANDSIDKNHIYTLAGNNHLRFMKKSDGQLVYEGTTNEEVLEILLHRIRGLNAQFPCEENREALAHLGIALSWLNVRTKRRVAQGVEGQDKLHASTGSEFP
jgi:hypothetical protein